MSIACFGGTGLQSVSSLGPPISHTATTGAVTCKACSVSTVLNYWCCTHEVYFASSIEFPLYSVNSKSFALYSKTLQPPGKLVRDFIWDIGIAKLRSSTGRHFTKPVLSLIHRSFLPIFRTIPQPDGTIVPSRHGPRGST